MTSSRDAARQTVRIAAGTGMLVAGAGHLSFARKGFQAQVPDWVPLMVATARWSTRTR